MTNTIVIDSFRGALCLYGWEQRSIWGWDAMTASLFAHLWPNSDDSDHPPIVIPSSWDPSARWPATTNPRSWPGTSCRPPDVPPWPCCGRWPTRLQCR